MTNYPIDPTLAENLAELKELCREIGAIEMHVIRRAPTVWIYVEDGTGESIRPLRLADNGLLFIVRFRNTDGGKLEVE